MGDGKRSRAGGRAVWRGHGQSAGGGGGGHGGGDRRGGDDGVKGVNSIEFNGGNAGVVRAGKGDGIAGGSAGGIEGNDRRGAVAGEHGEIGDSRGADGALGVGGLGAERIGAGGGWRPGKGVGGGGIDAERSGAVEELHAGHHAGAAAYDFIRGGGGESDLDVGQERGAVRRSIEGDNRSGVGFDAASAGDDEGVNLTGTGERAGEGHGHGVDAGLGGSGNVDLFDVVHVVHAGGGRQLHRCIRPGADKRHDVGQFDGAAIGGGDLEVEVVDEIRRADVDLSGDGRVEGGAGGVGPAEGGADGADPVPTEGVRLGFGGAGEGALDELGTGQAGFVGEDEISGGLHIDIAPAVLVVGASAADVVGSVDQKGLEGAGAEALAGEFAGVELLDQGGGADGVGRGHTGAAVGAVVGSSAGYGAGRGDEGYAGVDVDAVGGEVGFDAAVVAGTLAGEVGKGAG